MSKSPDIKRKPVVFLIPSPLDESDTGIIHPGIKDIVKQCPVFFTENERTARRYLKQIWKEIVIDDCEWFTIHKNEENLLSAFRKKIKEGKNIGIISEAGCPGIADPGQALVALAHEMNVTVKPLVGPSSVLLALMASGLNGQHFHFRGYLPINPGERVKTIRTIETEAIKNNCTQVFIETPYRNNQLLEAILKTCRAETRLCIAVDLTAESEEIKTMTVKDWALHSINLHKRPAIFLIGV